MSRQGASQESLDFLGGKPVVIEAADVQSTSAAGLLPTRQWDEVRGLTEQSAAGLSDPRRQASAVHSHRAMVRARVDGILADDPDPNDHGRHGRFESQETCLFLTHPGWKRRPPGHSAIGGCGAIRCSS
ncbi:MAG: hypothetical protein AB7I48_23435 [Planctomycetaceae bacterium]